MATSAPAGLDDSARSPRAAPAHERSGALPAESASTFWQAACSQGYIDAGVGPWHRCGVCTTGAVYCQGRAAYGALGAEMVEERGSARVRGIEDAREVVLGLAFACARTRAGQVWCWGWNHRGQLGRDPRSEHESSWSAAKVAGLSGVDALAAGREHVCALQQGRIWCWGANSYGQRGADGGAGAQPHPVAGIDDAVQITAGLDVSCARGVAGEVSCWGDNRLGQLGAPDLESSHEPVIVPGVENAIDIATDGVRGCALQRGGAVRCWGGREDETSSMKHQRFTFEDAERVFVVGDGVCVLTAGKRVVCVDAAGNHADTMAPLPGLGSLLSVDVTYGPQGCLVHGSGRMSCWGIQEDTSQ
jgi:alpha-tubulin suppressor-like RCC1 family protein